MRIEINNLKKISRDEMREHNIKETLTSRSNDNEKHMFGKNIVEKKTTLTSGANPAEEVGLVSDSFVTNDQLNEEIANID